MSRGAQMEQAVRRYYVIDVGTNGVVQKDVDLEELGRELDALEGLEELTRE